jgi:hypothetical protein
VGSAILVYFSVVWIGAAVLVSFTRRLDTLGLVVKALARRFGRSPTAVRLKAKRLGLRKYDECYTACSLAEALGVDPHWVLARIRSSKLRASHRQTERTPEQGGDSWHGINDTSSATQSAWGI